MWRGLKMKILAWQVLKTQVLICRLLLYTYVRQNRERCFFKREKNDTSNQKSQRCVGFEPKFPRFIGACSALASQTISNYKKNILNRCWLEESLHIGGTWLKLSFRDHQPALTPLSQLTVKLLTNTHWAFILFEHWCRLFLGEKWGSGMCCRNCSTSAATDAMTITNTTSQTEINSRRWPPYQECIGSFS